MELLSTIEARESARLERAWRYERLHDQAYRLRNDITRLEAQAPNTAALDEIARLLPSVPEGLITRGTRFVPGGQNVRDVLELTAANALDDLRKRVEKSTRSLDEARRKLAETEQLLAEFSVVGTGTATLDGLTAVGAGTVGEK